MMEWFGENWYVTLGLGVLLIIALLGLNRVSSGHNKLVQEREGKMKKLHELRTRFESMTPEAFDNEKDELLLDGVALYYQLRLQKAEDMNGAYVTLPPEARYVYALNIFYFEGGSLVAFYRNNGAPLASELVPALNAIGESELSELAETLEPMFDDEREDVSIDYKIIKSLEKKEKIIYNESQFKLKAAEYIRKNKAVFFSEI